MLLIPLILLLVFADKIAASERGTRVLSTDIEVEDEFATVRNNPDPKAKKKRMLNQWEKLWNHAAVIYQVDPTVGCPSSGKCQVMIAAMKEYAAKTCIRFKEWTGEKNYVRIFECSKIVGGGSAHVGMIGGQQNLRIAPKFWFKGTCMHELGHTLGLDDEVTRPDRDNYIEIIWENVHPDKLWPFTKTDRDRVNLLGQPYDFDSIMNYDKVAFSKDQSQFDTIRAKNGQKMSSCHFKNEISVGDVKKLQELYRCKGVQQKPCFPVDIVCHFNQNKCGFKEAAHWIWVFRTDPELETVGYLECKLDVTVSLEDHIRSINFHGLSPRDSKRGPNGCIKFVYQFVGYRHGHLSLEVLRIGLESTFDFVDAPPKDAISIWSTTVKARSTKWVRVSFPVDVLTPFALHFKFKLLDGTKSGSVKVDDFEVRYTSCDHPSHATPPDKSKVDFLKSLSSKAIKSMRPPSLKFSRSFSNGSSSSKRRRAASVSSDGSKVGWPRSWSSKLSRLKTLSSFGSFRSSFGSPSSNSFSISTPDPSKFSTES